MWGRGFQSVLIISASPTPGLRPGFLRKRDIRLYRAEPRPDTLSAVRGRGLSLIIEDLPSPVEPGLDLCRHLKADPATRSIPLIVVAPRETKRPALMAGADVVVAKPIVQREYFEAVRRFVRLARRRVLRQVVNLRFAYESERGSGQAFSRDLSVYGAFLKTDRALPRDTRIRVRFTIPGETSPVGCDAVVRRSTAYDPHSRQPGGFAIEFEGIAEDDLDRLERFVGRAAVRRPSFFRTEG